jgi:uncharacterized protein (UPF0335 family)
MALEVLISAETIRDALESTLEKFFKVERAEALKFAKRSLGEQALDVQKKVVGDILDVHLLKDIVKYALDDVSEHAEAIDKLGEGRAALLHVRHIEEIFTVVSFLVMHPDRYAEFQWRWKSFPVIHGIRNRLVNLKLPVVPPMQEWTNNNIANLNAYMHKKIGTDIEATKEHWEKVSNWLYPINLKDVFDKSGRKESYVSAEYDWNSQSVHFSPMAETYLGFELKHQSYSEFAEQSAARYIHGFCRECLPLVARTEILREYHAKMVLLEMYKILHMRPQQYVELANRGAQTSALTNLLLQGPADIKEVIDVAIGVAPQDPLAIIVR